MSETDTKTSHDPLCRSANSDGWCGDPCSCLCDCDLIAKVRADEREKAAKRVGAVYNEFAPHSYNSHKQWEACVLAARGEASDE